MAIPVQPMQWNLLDPQASLRAAQAPMQGASAAQELINSKNRNKLLQMHMAEFEANAPVREMQRQEFLDNAGLRTLENESKATQAEIESLYNGAVALKPLLDAGAYNEAADMLRRRRDNIAERGGDPSGTIEALNMLEEYQANPVTGQMALDTLKKMTDGIVSNGKAAADKAPHLTRVMADAQGQLWKFMSDGSVERTDVNKGVGIKYQSVTTTDAEGNENTQILAFREVIGPNGDYAGLSEGVPVDLRGTDPDKFMSSLPPGSVIGPQSMQSPQLGTVATATSPVEGAEARAEATERGKQSAVEASELRKGTVTDIQNAATHQSRNSNRVREIRNVRVNLTRALKKINPQTTGLLGVLMGGIPGTSARDTREILLSLQAFQAFDRLNQMRTEESITGGALGQVSNFEIELLKAAVQNLQQAQSEDQIREAMGLVGIRLAQLEEGAALRERYYSDVLDNQPRMSADQLISYAQKEASPVRDQIRRRGDYYAKQAELFISQPGFMPFQQPQQKHLDWLNDNRSKDKETEFYNLFGFIPEAST